ncbi:hypothetical protein FL583_33775, partial [Cryptosporangium phraense]
MSWGGSAGALSLASVSEVPLTGFGRTESTVEPPRVAETPASEKEPILRLSVAPTQLQVPDTDDSEDPEDEPVLFLEDLPDEFRQLIEAQLLAPQWMPARPVSGIQLPEPSALVPRLTMAPRQLVLNPAEDDSSAADGAESVGTGEAAGDSGEDERNSRNSGGGSALVSGGARLARRLLRPLAPLSRGQHQTPAEPAQPATPARPGPPATPAT